MNQDGNVDILSGSYSHGDSGGPMAGLFQVLWGKDDGSYRKAQNLCDEDYEPLTIGAADEKRGDQQRRSMLTRPTAADIDNDGHLDLIAGNAMGTFHFFKGKGKGKFEPNCRMLKHSGKPIRVKSGNSDPFIVDWDQDGDFDIVSGNGNGGVFLSINNGTKTKPAFQHFKMLIQPNRNTNNKEKLKVGIDHIKGPMYSTRVCVEDLNNDGLLDLIVGDKIQYQEFGEGISSMAEVAELKSKLGTQKASLDEQLAEIRSQLALLENSEDKDKAIEERKRLLKLKRQKQKQFMTQENRIANAIKFTTAGFVWVYYQQPNDEVERQTNSKPDSASTTSVQPKAATPELKTKSAANSNELSVSAKIESINKTEVNSLSPGDLAELAITIEVPDGYHIYGSRDSTYPTKIELNDLSQISAEPTEVPRGELREKFDGSRQFWIEGKQTIRIPFTVQDSAEPGTITVSGIVDFMICDERFCLPPKKIRFDAPIEIRQ